MRDVSRIDWHEVPRLLLMTSVREIGTVSANQNSKDCKSFVEDGVWLLQENDLTLTIGGSPIPPVPRKFAKSN